jgi:hypothetical protein
MTDYAVGDKVPSSLDFHYQRYVRFCERIGVPAGSNSEWLRCERYGYGNALSKASGGMGALTSYAASRKRVPAME